MSTVKVSRNDRDLWIRKDVYEELEAEAREKGKTVTELVCEIVMKHVKEERK